MEDSQSQGHRPRGPRLYHKKSRTGCLRCKQRRVKCDELRPSCGSCSRHVVDCVYPSQVAPPASSSKPSVARAGAKLAAGSTKSASSAVDGVTGAPAKTTTNKLAVASGSPHTSDSNPGQSPHSSNFYPSPSSSHPTPLDDPIEPDIDLPEGPWRRLWELRLLHNQQANLNQPFSANQSAEMRRMWTNEIPKMAMTMAQTQGRCSLLYIIFAQSALNLWTRSVDRQEREELIKLQQIYQLMCSKEQRRDIDELTQGIRQNADYICFASLRILSHSLALVQTLSRDPWEPPLQWLHMGRGAGEVFEMAQKLIETDSESPIMQFANSHPVIRDLQTTIYSDHSALGWLLEHPRPHSIEAQLDRELEDAEVRSVYEKAMAYTCSVRRAIDRGEAQFAIMWRLGGFSVYVPIELSRFIEERRPRALVILAHFMSLWLHYEHVWILGKAGEWQIRCIHSNLPDEWRPKVDGLFSKFQKPDVVMG